MFFHFEEFPFVKELLEQRNPCLIYSCLSLMEHLSSRFSLLSSKTTRRLCISLMFNRLPCRTGFHHVYSSSNSTVPRARTMFPLYQLDLLRHKLQNGQFNYIPYIPYQYVAHSSSQYKGLQSDTIVQVSDLLNQADHSPHLTTRSKDATRGSWHRY